MDINTMNHPKIRRKFPSIIRFDKRFPINNPNIETVENDSIKTQSIE